MAMTDSELPVIDEQQGSSTERAALLDSESDGSQARGLCRLSSWSESEPPPFLVEENAPRRGRTISLVMADLLPTLQQQSSMSRATSFLGTMSIDERSTEASIRLQRAFRGHRMRRQLARLIQYNYAKGSLEEAARFAQSQVRRQPSGEPYMLNTPLESFHAFGPAVNAYMVRSRRYSHLA